MGILAVGGSVGDPSLFSMAASSSVLLPANVLTTRRPGEGTGRPVYAVGQLPSSHTLHVFRSFASDVSMQCITRVCCRFTKRDLNGICNSRVSVAYSLQIGPEI